MNSRYLLITLSLFAAGITFAWWQLSVSRDAIPEVLPALTALIQHCDEKKARASFLHCVRNDIDILITKYSVSQVLTALDGIFLKNDLPLPGQSISCHDLAHIVGEVSALHMQDAYPMTHCTRVCGYGCFHGVASGILKKNPSLLNDLPALCAPFAHNSFPGQDRTACFHGLGHGLADLAGRDIPKALLLCDYLETTSSQIECGTGVLMEIIDAPTFAQPRFILPASVPQFCHTLPGIYQEVCLKNAGGYTFRRSGDAQEAFLVCASLTRELTRDCAVALGADFHFIFKGDIDLIMSACGAGALDQQQPCFEGALFSGLVSDPSGMHGAALCRSLSADFQYPCFSHLGASMERLSHNQSLFCAELFPNERPACLNRPTAQ